MSCKHKWVGNIECYGFLGLYYRIFVTCSKCFESKRLPQKFGYFSQAENHLKELLKEQSE